MAFVCVSVSVHDLSVNVRSKSSRRRTRFCDPADHIATPRHKYGVLIMVHVLSESHIHDMKNESVDQWVQELECCTSITFYEKR